MIGFFIAIHVIACVLLIILILIQQGRGGGLVEGLSGVESAFGPKTNAFLTRTTSVLAVLFFITCLSLAFLSARQNRSLMSNTDAKKIAEKVTSENKASAPVTPKATAEEPISQAPEAATTQPAAESTAPTTPTTPATPTPASAQAENK